MTSCKLGLGCWGLGGDAYGEVDENHCRELLDLAQNQEILLFDTSPSYGFGVSESRLGNFINLEKKNLISTKVGLHPHSGTEMPFDLSRVGMLHSIKQSLKRLRMDCLPLVQVHSPPLDVLDIFPNLLADLDFIQREGLVSNWGISLQKPSHLKFFSEMYSWSTYQLNFSLIDQRAFKELEVLSLGESKIIVRTPLNFGFLTDNFEFQKAKNDKFSHLSKWPEGQLFMWQNSSSEMGKISREWGMKLQHLAIRFVLDSGVANFVIPGATDCEELADNLLAFRLPPLERWQIAKLREKYEILEKGFSLVSPFSYKVQSSRI